MIKNAMEAAEEDSIQISHRKRGTLQLSDWLNNINGRSQKLDDATTDFLIFSRLY